MATEHRPQRERRENERRRNPGESVDVMRLEHENLCGQVEAVLHRLGQLEAVLRGYRDRLEAVERDMASRFPRVMKSLQR